MINPCEIRKCRRCEEWLYSGYDSPYGPLGVCKVLFYGRLAKDRYATICTAYKKGNESNADRIKRVKTLKAVTQCEKQT
jgi:hypothetical protein